MGSIYCWAWTDCGSPEELDVAEWVELDLSVLHRLDGPAIEFVSGEERWFIDGKELPEDRVQGWIEENDVDITTEEGQMALKIMWV